MWQGNHQDHIQEAAQALRQGGLVAFPTETVYGLGADGLNPQACRAIFKAKGRPADNPLILHIADFQDLAPLVQDIPPQAKVLAQAFWPGPLTMIFKKSPLVPEVVSAGLETVAIRMPDHPVALALIRATGRPLAAPSANISGRPSPTSAAHVAEDFPTGLAGIVDGGPCHVGLESTILNMTTQPPSLLRPGGLSREALQDLIGPLQIPGTNPQDPPQAPGMKYRHYAPKSPLYLIDPKDPIGQVTRLWAQGPSHLGFLLSEDTLKALPPPPPGARIVNMGPKARPDLAAQKLFASLRDMDAQGVQAIYAEVWDTKGLGQALMNRLEKARGDHHKEDSL